MQLNNILNDDEAVSPVIGVILMVAITVILAAVIGTFVLGLGDQVSDTNPQASFTFEQTTYDPGSDTTDVPAVEITHDGGDKLDGSNINVLVNGDEAYAASSSDEVETPFTGEITAGTTSTIVARIPTSTFDPVTVSEGTADEYTDDDDGALDVDDVSDATSDEDGATGVQLASDDEVRIVWSSSSGGDTATLGKFTLA